MSGYAGISEERQGFAANGRDRLASRRLKLITRGRIILPGVRSTMMLADRDIKRIQMKNEGFTGTVVSLEL